jgi:hypothetical protein
MLCHVSSGSAYIYVHILNSRFDDLESQVGNCCVMRWRIRKPSNEEIYFTVLPDIVLMLETVSTSETSV